MTGKKYTWKFTPEVVNGVCPTCEEETLLSLCEDHSGTNPRYAERRKMMIENLGNCTMPDGSKRKTIEDECGECKKGDSIITAAQPDESYCEIEGGTWTPGTWEEIPWEEPQENDDDDGEIQDFNWNLMGDYDFDKAWYASKNNCSGHLTNYKTIKTFAQGEDGAKCPNFNIEQSRGNFDPIYHPFEKFVKGDSCTIPKMMCVAGSSCIVDTNKIEALVKRINQTPNVYSDVVTTDRNGGRDLPEDDTLKIEIDGTTYSHENKITNEVLYRLVRTVCDRYGDVSAFGESSKTLCSTDKNVYYQPTNPGKKPCAYGDGDDYKCYRYDKNGIKDGGFRIDVTSDVWEKDGIKVTYRYTENISVSANKDYIYKWGTKYIKPYELCKWIDMPDPPEY